jgi:murein DD-endopeptidase MepM/ murein hydrolase activator NlpD
MTTNMVNFRIASRLAILCCVGVIAANCSVTPRPFDPAYRPAPATFFTVSVRPGDTVSEIAERYRVKEEDIVALNGITNPDRIISGDQLFVPAYGLATAPRNWNTANVNTASVNSGSVSSAGVQPRQVSYRNNNSRIETSPIPDAAPVPADRFLWPVSGRVISEFGPGLNGERNDGINIVADRGTPFRAAQAGTVTYVGSELRSFGNLLLIQHDNGYVTAYAHAEGFLVERGQRVQAGQFVGHLGATGDVSEPQLHFEIRQGTRPVNPASLLAEIPTSHASLTPSDPASS